MGDFQSAKRLAEKAFVAGGYGHWLKKPVEEQMFEWIGFLLLSRNVSLHALLGSTTLESLAPENRTRNRLCLVLLSFYLSDFVAVRYFCDKSSATDRFLVIHNFFKDNGRLCCPFYLPIKFHGSLFKFTCFLEMTDIIMCVFFLLQSTFILYR